MSWDQEYKFDTSKQPHILVHKTAFDIRSNLSQVGRVCSVRNS